jgi:hypothetical protein
VGLTLVAVTLGCRSVGPGLNDLAFDLLGDETIQALTLTAVDHRWTR